MLADLHIDFDALLGHREFMELLRELTAKHRAEVAELTAFQRELNPDFYASLAEPDEFAMALEGSDEMFAAWAARIEQAGKPKKRKPKHRPAGKRLLLDGPKRR